MKIQLSMNQEAGPYQTQKSSGTLILDFLASRKVRNKFVVHKSPSLWYPVIAAQTEERGEKMKKRGAERIW